MAAIHTRGPLLINCLHDIPAHAQEISLHGICRSAAVALAVAQVQIGHDLHTMELAFLMANDPDMHKELIEDFDDAAAAIVDITPAKGIVNKVFD